MKEIPLYGKYGAGKFVMVDDEDFDRVNQYRWGVKSDGKIIVGTSKSLRTKHLSLFLLGLNRCKNVRHKDGNIYNCQKNNLCYVIHDKEKFYKINKIETPCKYYRIALTGKHGEGKFAVVDGYNYHYLKQFAWHGTEDGYARSKINKKNVYMHHVVFGEKYNKKIMLIDHRDCNRINNTIENLRLVTYQENTWNVKETCNNSTGFTGVSLEKGTQKYRARINVNYKNIHLGCFDTLEDAINARMLAKEKYHVIKSDVPVYA